MAVHSFYIIRLLKNTHLLRCAHPSSLRRTRKYNSFLRISRALHLDVFDQPVKDYFFNNLLGYNQKKPVVNFKLAVF